MNTHESDLDMKTTDQIRVKVNLRVAPSVKDERVYAIVAKSLFSYITSVPNFWNVIYAKLFVQ